MIHMRSINQKSYRHDNQSEINPPNIGAKIGAIETIIENQASRFIISFLSGWSPIHICELNSANPAEKACMHRPMLKIVISVAEPHKIHPKKQPINEICNKRFLGNRSQIGPKNRKLNIRQK